jgi:hypothetical protein
VGYHELGWSHSGSYIVVYLLTQCALLFSFLQSCETIFSDQDAVHRKLGWG